jgi:peptidyl-dipeptidase Dcp
LKPNICSHTIVYPEVAENAMSTAFSHLQGGYSSGYYTAEVLDADAFEYFQEKESFIKK